MRLPIWGPECCGRDAALTVGVQIGVVAGGVQIGVVAGGRTGVLAIGGEV